jgi:signal transduction histidine kinase
VREHLFEPFYTTKNDGTGLGLAVARQIVEAHGGTIGVEPNEPRGTRFVIELPLQQEKGTA